MPKHNDAITTSGHSSLEKYTSHFIWKFERVAKGFTVWEISWRLNRTATYWPPHPDSSVHHSVFPVLLGCTTWGPGPQPLLRHGSHSSIFTPTDLNVWRPPTSRERHNFALNSTPRQSRSPLIFWYLRPDAPVIYTGAFLLLTAWPGQRSICNKSTGAEEYADWISA